MMVVNIILKNVIRLVKNALKEEIQKAIIVLYVKMIILKMGMIFQKNVQKVFLKKTKNV